MKKQVISLVMVLAMVILAGTSAMAQTDPADNQSTEVYPMIVGSTHTFSITKGRANSNLSWTVYTGLTGTTDGTSNVTVTGGSTSTDYTITWNNDATLGNYAISVTETNLATEGGCSTERRFYVNLIDFDVLVYASDDAALELTDAADLAYCGDGSTSNYGDENNGEAFSNQFNPTDIGSSGVGVLDGYTGTDALDRDATTDGYTNRWVTVAIRWSDDITDVNDIPAIDTISFDYTAAVNHDLMGVNGNANTTAGSAVSIEIGTTANGVSAPATLPTGLTDDEYTVYYTFPIQFYDRWLGATVATDITMQLSAANLELIANGAVIGAETPTNETAAGTELGNTSATQTIYLAPATSTISIN